MSGPAINLEVTPGASAPVKVVKAGSAQDKQSNPSKPAADAPKPSAQPKAAAPAPAAKAPAAKAPAAKAPDDKAPTPEKENKPKPRRRAGSKDATRPRSASKDE